MDGYGVVTVGRDDSGIIIVSFFYDPRLVAQVKTIEGRKWHKDKKYWGVPCSDGTLEKILTVFEGEEILLDPTLTPPSPLNLRGERGELAFEDLRRELVSRKYSHQTVKVYLYYNRDLPNFAGKTVLFIDYPQRQITLRNFVIICFKSVII
ncbi:MAG: hypothetical protein ABID54_04790 [Pseudomonadota bacterium]